jgi:adenosylhomocysteine nucleosidase
MTGIIAAMDSELEAILKLMKDYTQKEVAGVRFYEGTLGDMPVVMCKCGVGKVMAACTATILCMSYPVDTLINVGVAGGLLDEQNVMDLVIADCAIQADFDTSPLDGPQGIGLVYKTSPRLVKEFSQAANQLQIPYTIGAIATQDLFMSRKEDYEKLNANFENCACSEMEGGAIAAVAKQFGIECMILRSLSDVVTHHDNSMEFAEFACAASEQVARLLSVWQQK